MKNNSSFDDRDLWRNLQDVSNKTGYSNKDSMGAMDMVKRDRFELLSAYLDGEVTAAESRQVEEWLAKDACVQRLYTRLLNLREGMRNIPVPPVHQSPEVTANQVFEGVRRPSRLVLGMGGAVAACILGAVSTFLPGGELNTPQLAQTQPTGSTEDSIQVIAAVSPLMVALNHPVIEIPKAAMASPQEFGNVEPQLQEIQPNIN
jgi:anti-sigma factor RsiW